MITESQPLTLGVELELQLLCAGVALLGVARRSGREQRVEEGGRLFSQYTAKSGKRFWVITECDRSATTVLLPEEY